MTVLSCSEALRLAMTEEMEKDDKVFLLGEDIGIYGGAFGITSGMVEKFGPERIMDTPISEGSFVGVAVGSAIMGSRPVVEIMFMDFITLSVDQLVNQAAKIRYVYGEQAKCPMVVRAVGGAGRSYGPTHSQNLEAWFMHVPGLKVVAPSNAQDYYILMKAAIRDNNPVIFLEHKCLYPIKSEVRKIDKVPKLGNAEKIIDGSDITVISYSYMTFEALAAAKLLEKSGVSVELIDLRILNPLDQKTIIESVSKTGKAVIVSEENRTAGVAAEIAALIAEHALDYLEAPVKRVTIPDIPVPASSPMEKEVIPGKYDIVNAAKELLDYT